MDKFLYVVYDFPPIGGSGVQRPLKFIKYLAKGDWEPVILTVTEKEKAVGLRDFSLIKEIPESIPVYRAKLMDPHDNFIHHLLLGSRRKISSQVLDEKEIVQERKKVTLLKRIRKRLGGFIHSLMIPDRLIGWIPFAVNLGREAIRKEKPELIYTTSWPVSSHVIGYFLARRYKIPWVMEFRDPWTNYDFGVRRPVPVRWMENKMERLFLRKASRIITVNPYLKEYFIKKNPGLNPDDIKVITNGYDEADFDGISPIKFEKMTFLFLGRVYNDSMVKPLFEVFSRLKKKDEKYQKKIEFLLVGVPHENFEKLAEEYGVTEMVRMVFYLEHRESLRYLMGTDICYYNFDSTISVAGKIFEYLRSGKFILANAPVGNWADEIIKKTRSGCCIDHDDLDSLEAKIEELYSVFEKEGRVPPVESDRNEVEKFSRKNLTKALEELFEGILEEERDVKKGINPC